MGKIRIKTPFLVIIRIIEAFNGKNGTNCVIPGGQGVFLPPKITRRVPFFTIKRLYDWCL